ncbi:MAG: hypothetical protein K2N14_03690 [Clostridia bacterium]|nr:hypothetical protein [Clostridia bacterium]
MKLFKRPIILAVCAAIASLSFSGCNILFGNRCNHTGSNNGSYDEQSHYRICSDCGEKYAVKNHTMIMTYLNGNDKSQHFMKCQYCEYSQSYAPHVLSDWDYSRGYSIRECTAEGCGYKETCSHADTRKYVVSDDGHYTTCEYCKANVTDKTEHIYKTYTDITETSHSLSCECGKVSSEIIPHDFKYHQKDDSHWQTCICGFETDKEACTYGDYESTNSSHYKVCLFCEGIGMMENHYHELTEDRKRVCPECLHEEKPYDILLGTWKYNYGWEVYKLTLNADWSYTLVYHKTSLSVGHEIESGDYSVNYYKGLDGKISGTIFLRPSTGYGSSSIGYEFKKGVTDKFMTTGDKVYYKQ